MYNYLQSQIVNEKHLAVMLFGLVFQGGFSFFLWVVFCIYRKCTFLERGKIFMSSKAVKHYFVNLFEIL